MAPSKFPMDRNPELQLGSLSDPYQAKVQDCGQVESNIEIRTALAGSSSIHERTPVDYKDNLGSMVMI